MKVLISAPYFQPVINRFKHEFDKRNLEMVIPTVHERLTEAQLLDIISDIDGVLCGDDAFTVKVLDKAKKLKVISKWGTGIDSLNKVECEKRNIKVCNTPNAFSIPVADTVLAYALNFVRNISSMDQMMKNGIWEKIPGKTLSECVFGIVGFGNIGTQVAKRVQSFGSKIIATDILSISNEKLSEYGVVMTDLDTVLKTSDIISLNTDLNDTSRHLINRNTLSKMKKSAYLINTSRGPVINEEDLVWALQNGVIAGAGLDVFEHEPLPVNSPLRGMKQVSIAPHNSNSSPVAWEKVHLNTMKNLFEVLGV